MKIYKQRKVMQGNDNPTFTSDDVVHNKLNCKEGSVIEEKQRDQWGKDIEFLFSCIALSVRWLSLSNFPN